MKRAFFFVPALGFVVWSCGSGTSTGSTSGSSEVDATAASDASTASDGAVRTAPDGAVCSKQMVTVPESAASSNPSGGPSGCAKDEDCAVRYQGDYCDCPREPRPITKGSSIAFDEGLNGITVSCTCALPSTCDKPSANAYCNMGVCALR